MQVLVQLAPFFLCALLVLIVPGYLVGRMVGAGRFRSFAQASGISTAIYAATAVVLKFVGLPYARTTAWVSTAAVLIVFGIYAFLSGRVSRTSTAAATSARTRENTSAAWWAATGLAVVLMIVQFVRFMPAAGSISQTYDNIYHLNALRWIMDTGNGSSLAFDMTAKDGMFYPSAWHDVVTLVLMTLGSEQIPHGVNAVTLVVLAVTWTSGMVWLCKSLVGKDRWVLALGVGILVTAFPAVTIRMVGFGVLYPFAFALALLPSAWAVVAEMTCQTPSDGSKIPLRHELLIVFAMIGAISLAHASVFVVFLIPLVVTALVSAAQELLSASRDQGFVAALRRSSLKRRLWVTVALTVFSGLVWIVARPTFAGWPAVTSVAQGLGELIAVSPLGQRMAWIPAAMVLIGLWTLVRSKDRIWLWLSYAVFAGLFLVGGSISNPFLRTWLVGTWYQDPERMAALLHLSAVPMAAVGWAQALTWLDRRVKHTTTRRISSIAVVAALLGFTQMAPYLESRLDGTRAFYTSSWDAPLLSTSEMILLGRLSTTVPEGAGIAVIPWNGSAMAYPLTGRLVTEHHILYDLTSHTYTVNTRLDDVAVDPTVCPALQALDVQYVLDFGDRDVATKDASQRKDNYSGFEDLRTAEGFTLVDRAGDSRLYKITACS